MKMSEIMEQAKALRKLQSEREEAATLLDLGEEEGHLSICSDAGRYIEFDKGTAQYDALASMVRAHQADVETRMRAMGVEIDVPALQPDEDDPRETEAARVA